MRVTVTHCFLICAVYCSEQFTFFWNIVFITLSRFKVKMFSLPFHEFVFTILEQDHTVSFSQTFQEVTLHRLNVFVLADC